MINPNPLWLVALGCLILIVAILLVVVIWRHSIYIKGKQRMPFFHPPTPVWDDPRPPRVAADIPRQDFRLIVDYPDGRREQLRIGKYALAGAGETIGRDGNECSLPFDGPSISRQHARLFWRDGAVWIEDLDSTNGTFTHDGSRIRPNQPSRLNREESFRLANIRCEIV